MASAPRRKPLRAAPQFHAQVTPEIVERGVAKNSNHCMIAEAVKEAYPKLSHVSVDIQTIRGTDKERGERYIWFTPRNVQRAIIDFDQGKAIKPFAFKLNSGGQTVAVHRYSEETKAKMLAAYHKRKRDKKKVVYGKNRGPSHGSAPSVIGGQAPPKGAGARRQFGLRSLTI